MTQLMKEPSTETQAAADLPTAILRVLASALEPLTVSKIRVALPASHRSRTLEELNECLRGQVAANVLQQYPKYRSQQDRFWDRPMPVHVAAVLRETLQEAPLSWSELRRKLPAYALPHAETVLAEQVSQGLLYRHPPASKRSGERFGAQPPNPREYVQAELSDLFLRLEPLGFTQSQLRASALELLHDEEWAPTPPETLPATSDQTAAPSGEPTRPTDESPQTQRASFPGPESGNPT